MAKKIYKIIPSTKFQSLNGATLSTTTRHIPQKIYFENNKDYKYTQRELHQRIQAFTVKSMTIEFNGTTKQNKKWSPKSAVIHSPNQSKNNNIRPSRCTTN